MKENKSSPSWRRCLKRSLAALSAGLFAFSCAPLLAEEDNDPPFDGFSVEIGDALYFEGFTSLTPMAKNQPQRLRNDPDITVTWQDDALFVEQDGQKRQMADAVPVSPWWPSVSWIDIDFDGKPEFFVLEQGAMQGSIYRLLSTQGIFPSSLFKAPPASLVASGDLLFKDGRSPEPAFFSKDRRLEFYARLGPYYTAEIWRWDGSGYVLVEQRRPIYSPEIGNGPMAFMERLQFDEQGRRTGVTYHPTRTVNFAPLRYTAFLPIPFYSAPSDKAQPLGILPPGASFEIVGYDKNNEGGESDENSLPLLWLKATEVGGDRTGWVRLDLIRMKVKGGRLVTEDLFNPLMEDYQDQPARIIGEPMTKDGMEAQQGDDPSFSWLLDGYAVVPYARNP